MGVKSVHDCGMQTVAPGRIPSVQFTLLSVGLFWSTSNAVTPYRLPRLAQVELESTAMFRPVSAQTADVVVLLPSGVEEGPGMDTDEAATVGGFVTLYAERAEPQVWSAD